MRRDKPDSSSHIGVPVTAVFGCEGAGDEKHNVHNPPYPHTAQRQQLPHGCPGVAQAESVHAQEAEQDAVDEGGHKVVPTVPGGEEEEDEKRGGLRRG